MSRAKGVCYMKAMFIISRLLDEAKNENIILVLRMNLKFESVTSLEFVLALHLELRILLPQLVI